MVSETFAEPPDFLKPGYLDKVSIILRFAQKGRMDNHHQRRSVGRIFD
jgi:hypothetical protein